MPWTRCGRPYVLITGVGVPLFPLERLSLPLDDELFRRAIIAPVFISAALASAIFVAILYIAVARNVQRMSAAQELSADGSVVVLGSNATTLATGAGTVVEVSGEHVRILTAKHVAVFGGLSVRFGPDATVPAQILTLMAGHDVAVIETVVPPLLASQLHVARIGVARRDERVTIGGSQVDGSPDTESADVTQTGGYLPDGPANGRFALACALCHRGDSGAGVFDAAGVLIGVYVGYWTYANGERMSVAELPDGGTEAALSTPFSSATFASVRERNDPADPRKVTR